jgi:hypothetical protein
MRFGRQNLQETDARDCAIRRDRFQLERMPDQLCAGSGRDVGGRHRLLRPARRSSKSIVKDIGFAPMPAGPKAQHSAMFCSGLCIPAASKNKVGAWLYIQWAADKANCAEIRRLGAGMPPRASAFRNEAVRKSSAFPPNGSKPRLPARTSSGPGCRRSSLSPNSAISSAWR